MVKSKKKSPVKSCVSASGRRLRRNVQNGATGDAIGLSRKEEQELNKALYASLYEKRRTRSLPDTFRGKDKASSDPYSHRHDDNQQQRFTDGRHRINPVAQISPKRQKLMHNRRQTLGTVSATCHRRYDELTDSRERENLPTAHTLTTTVTPVHRLHVDESSQDSVRSCDSSASESKRKIHAIRKFASGVPLPKPARSRHMHSVKSTNPVVKMLSSKIPKTEDFLTFLCLRDSTVLPRHLDFLDHEEDSSSTSDRVSTDHQGENMEELRDECRENRSEVTESEIGCLTNHRECNTNQSAVRARASTRDTACGLISLIKRLQSRVSTSSSTSSPSFSHLNTNLRSGSVTGQSNRKFSISGELSQSVTQTDVRHSNSKDHRIASSRLSSPEPLHPVNLLSHAAISQQLATKTSHNPPLSLTVPSSSLEYSSGTTKRQRHYSRLIKDQTNNHTCSDNPLAVSDLRKHLKSSEVLAAEAAEILESPSTPSSTLAALGTSSVTACSSFSTLSLSSDPTSRAPPAMPTNPEFMQPPSHMSSKPTAGLLHSHSSPCNHHPNMPMTEREGDGHNFTSQHNLSVHTTSLVTPSLSSTLGCSHHHFPTPKGNCVCLDSTCSAPAAPRTSCYACCKNNSNSCYNSNHIVSRRSSNLPSYQVSQNSCMKHFCDGSYLSKTLHESNLSSSSHGNNCEVCPQLLHDDCLCSQGMYESAHCTRKWQGRNGVSMQAHCRGQFCHKKLQMIHSANLNVKPGSNYSAKCACLCGGPTASSENGWDESNADRFAHNSHALKNDDQNDFDEENDDIGNENMTDSDEESNSPNSRETGQDDGLSSWCCESQLPASSWSFMDQQTGFSNRVTEDTSTDSMEDDVHRDIDDDSEMYDHLSYSVVSEVKHDEDLIDDKSNTALGNAEGKNDMNDKYVNERYIRRRHRIDRKKAKRSKSKYHLVREIPKLKIRIVRKNASVNSANISRLEARGMPEDTCSISHNTHSRVDTTTRSADFQTEFVKMLQAGGTVTSATKKTFQTGSLKKAHNSNHAVGLTTPSSHTAQVQDDDLQEQNQHTKAREENIPEEEVLQPHSPANNVIFRDGGGLAVNEQQFSSSEKSKLDTTQTRQRHVLENKVNNERVSQAASTDPMHTSESSSESSQLADSLILRDKVISAFAKFNRKDIIVSSIEASKSSWINEADVLYAFADSDSTCKHPCGGENETLSHSTSAVDASSSEGLNKSKFDDSNTVDLEAIHNETSSDGKQPAAQACESAANKSCDVELQVCLSELRETNDVINGYSKEKQHSVIQNPPAGRCDTFDKQCGSVKDCDEEMPEVGNKNENEEANAHKENVEKDLRDKEAVKAEKEVRINTKNAVMKVMQHKENQFTQKDDEKQPDTHKVPKQMSVGTQMTRSNSSCDESEKMDLKLSKHEDCDLKRSVNERHTQTELMINECREIRRISSESQEEAETVSSTHSRTCANQSNCKNPVISNDKCTSTDRFECRTWSKDKCEEHNNTKIADTSSHASSLCGDKRHEWKISEQSMETSGSRKAEVGVQTSEDKATQISIDQGNNHSSDNTDRQSQVSDPQRDKHNKISKSVDSSCQTEITSHDDMAATSNEGNNANCHETESSKLDTIFSSNRGVDLAMKRKRFHMSRAYAQTSCEDMPDVSTEALNCKTSVTGNVGPRTQSGVSDCMREIDNRNDAVIVEGKRRMNVSMDSQADDSHDGDFCSEANDFTDLVIDLSLSGRNNRNSSSSNDSDCSSSNNRDIVSCSGNQLEIIELTTSCSINKEGRSNSRGRMSVTLEYMNEGDVLDSPIDMTIKRSLPVSSLPTEIIYSKSHSSRNSSETQNQVTKCSCKNSDKVLTSQLEHQNKVMQNDDTLENRSRLSQDTMMSRDSHENGRNFTKSNRTASSTVQNSETSQRHPSEAPRFEKSDVPVSTSNSNLQPSIASTHSNGKSIVFQGGRNGIMNKQSKAQASAIYSETKKNPAFLSKSMDSKCVQRDEAIVLHSYGSLNTGQGFAMVNGQLQHCEILDKRNIAVKKADHTRGVNNDRSRIKPSDNSQQLQSGEKIESKKPVHSFSNNQIKPKSSISLKKRKHPYERTASCPKISALPSQKFEKCSSHQRVPSNHHRNKASCHSYTGNEKKNSSGCHFRNDSIGPQNSGGHHGVRFANSYFSLSDNMDQFEISEQRNLFPALSLCLNDPPLSPVNTNDFTQFIITPRHTGRQRSNVCSQSCKGVSDHGHTQSCYHVNSGHHQMNTDNFMHHREAVASRNIDPVPWRSSDTQPLASNNQCSMVQQSSGATLQSERPTQNSCLARLPSQQSSSFPLSYNSQSLEGASESSEENAAQPQSTGSTVCHVQAHPSCPSTMPSAVSDTADESPENLHVASDKDILRSSYISELANKVSDTSLNSMHNASGYDGSRYSKCELPSRPKNLSKSHSFSSGTQGNSLSSEHLHQNKILDPKEVSQARTFHGKSLSFDMTGRNATFSSTSRPVPRMGKAAIPNGCSTDIASSMGNSQHQTSSAPSTSACLDLSKSGRDLTRQTTHSSPREAPASNCREISTYVASTNSIVGLPAQTISSIPSCHSNTSSALINSAISSQASTQNSFTSNPLSLPTSHTGSYGSSSRNLFSSALPLTAADFESAISSALSTSSTSMRGGTDLDDILSATYMESLGTLRSAGLGTSATSTASSDGSDGNVLDVIMEELKIQIALLKDEIMKDSQSKNSRKQSRKRSGLETLQFTDSALNVPGTSSSNAKSRPQNGKKTAGVKVSTNNLGTIPRLESEEDIDSSNRDLLHLFTLKVQDGILMNIPSVANGEDLVSADTDTKECIEIVSDGED